MGREWPVTAMAVAAPEVRLEPGFPAAIDDAAAAADPRHAFLRRAWFAGFGGRDAATLVARRADGAPLAALPLAPIGPAALGLRAVPGSYWPLRSFPVAADAGDAELIQLLASPPARAALGRGWRLGPVPADDPAAARLRRLAPRCGFTLLERGAGTPYALDIAGARRGGPWPRPSTLRNLHKQEKKLARLGALDWKLVRGAAWDAEAFDTLARIEAASWVGRRAGADAKFVDPAMRAGWDAVARDPQLAEGLSCGILSIGGEPAAFSFGLDCGAVRYCIATGYDARFARHSPGYWTCYQTYVDAAERGVERLELGCGDGGEKSGMGAAAGAPLIDCLFVRGAALAALLRPLWMRSGKS